MKKLKFLTILLIPFLVSCTKSQTPDSETELASESETESEVEVVSSLDVPILTIENNIVSWDEVDNAEGYEYYLSSNKESVVTLENYVTLNEGENVSVRAFNLTYNVYSEYSKALSYVSNVSKDTYYKFNTVYFHNSDIKPISILYGENLTKPNDPIKEHYEFISWYKDPYFKEEFDFNSKIYLDTIIYAKWVAKDYIDATYWVKCNEFISADIMYDREPPHWDYIRLNLIENASIKEYKVDVTVKGASVSDPAKFLIVDGLDSGADRNYWKYNNEDFSINSDGIYRITFSVDTEYKFNGIITHAKYQLISPVNNSIDTSNNDEILISVDEINNKATWNIISSCRNYEIIFNNNEVISTTTNLVNSVSLKDGEFISVRARYASSYSRWSHTAINFIYLEEDTNNKDVYLYLTLANTAGIKYQIGDSINELPTLNKEGFNFDGWYFDISFKNKVSLPFIINKNTYLYPKFISNNSDDTVYYYLKDSNNQIVSGLTWNKSNYDYYEYETSSIYLIQNETYYISTLDGSKRWEDISVNSSEDYKIYFSPSYVWNVDTPNACHYYVRALYLDIYFSSPSSWSKCNYYCWRGDNKAPLYTWPGRECIYVRTNSYGEKIYKARLNTSIYNWIIFNDGNKNQTVDIPLDGVENNTGFYISGSGYGTYKYSE